MPLHVARLRDSDLASEVDPEACWYAVLLWAASWHQLPAGSLPDNEIVLTKLCGLGRDVRTFRKHRAGALRGFVLCDDGRLYHPVVAEQVKAAWESKLQQRWRSELARIKKANQRNGTTIEPPTYEAFLASIGEGTSLPSPQSVPGDTEFCPPGHRLQETGTGTGISEEEANASPVGSDAPTEVGLFGDPEAETPKARPKPWEASPALEAFWQAAGPQMRTRSSKAKVWPEWKRVSRQTGEEALIGAMRRYLAGDADYQRTGGPGLHIWLKDAKWEHWLADIPGAASAPVQVFPDPDIRAAVVREHGEDFARRSLDYCDYRDGVLIAPNEFTLRRVKDHAASLLKTLGVKSARIAKTEVAA